MSFLPSKTLIALAALAGTLFASSFAAAEDVDPVPAVCPGCASHVDGPTYTNNGLTGACDTEVRVTVAQASGVCKQANIFAPCLATKGCQFGLTLEYKSTCNVTGALTTGAFNPIWVSPILPPSATWKTYYTLPMTTVECGVGSFTLKGAVGDAAGGIAIGTVQLSCTPCS